MGQADAVDGLPVRVQPMNGSRMGMQVDVFRPAVSATHPTLGGYGAVRVTDLATGMTEECAAYRYARMNERAAIQALNARLSRTDP